MPIRPRAGRSRGLAAQTRILGYLAAFGVEAAGALASRAGRRSALGSVSASGAFAVAPLV